MRERYEELVNTFVNSPNESGYEFTGVQEGIIRTPTPLRLLLEADFKSPKAHSPSGNVHLVNSFVSDRRLRGLSPRACQFYEGYLTRFVNTIYKLLLDISKSDIATVLASLDCNAGGKHAYFRVLRAWASMLQVGTIERMIALYFSPHLTLRHLGGGLFDS